MVSVKAVEWHLSRIYRKLGIRSRHGAGADPRHRGSDPAPRLPRMADRTTHTALRMGGRDPHESVRTATPLELLFDLTFVIAYGAAADQLADQIAHHHTREGLIGFGFAIFAVTWAWIFWTWFSSAYDTDDWIYRLLTMVQMVGVLILALGLPVMFESLVEGDHVDNSVMVIGYVVMRVPMVLQWWRASRAGPRPAPARPGDDADHPCCPRWPGARSSSPTCPSGRSSSVVVPLVLVEFAGPVLAETRYGGTPWHPHHIAERYGLLVIITLGEGLLGTVIALRTRDRGGWSLDAAVLGFAGTAMIFGLWWSYFVIPHGHLLHAHRERSLRLGLWTDGAVRRAGGGRRRPARGGVPPRRRVRRQPR